MVTFVVVIVVFSLSGSDIATFGAVNGARNHTMWFFRFTFLVTGPELQLLAARCFIRHKKPSDVLH